MNDAFSYGKVQDVATDILSIPFLTPEYVEYILECCKELDSWEPFKGDRSFSTWDIHFKKELPELYETLAEVLDEQILPTVCRWWDIDPIEVSDMFALRYTLDSQRHLKLHHDDSYISGSIKLSEDYVGGVLNFPRQQFNNESVPIGDILMWPSMITHPHESQELSSGVKYSLTIWTKQCT